ncbi:MAG: HYR domain-containing protein, partial [Verrucomicrobiae bacterium]|nr:HYR domain-containing protein [Verrucomicrobiae bacterium]
SSSNFWYCDRVVEQILPVNTWGTDFYVAPLATRSGGDVFRILAGYDNTIISVQGVPTVILNRGGFHQIILTAPARIAASKPVLIAQFANSSDYDRVLNADPFMLQIQATRHYTTAYIFSTPTNDFPTNYLHLISPTAAAGTVRLDGTVIGAASFSPIPGTTYSFARILLTPGPHVVTGDQPFGASIYGWAEYDSYAHPACFYFGDVAGPQITPATTAVTDSVANYPNTPGQAPVPSIVGTTQVSDNCSGTVSKPTQTPPPGTLLGPGVHTLTISSTDNSGNEGEATVLFTVLDPSPVLITCPADIVTRCTTNNGAFVRFTVTARTTYDTNVTVTSTPPSGSFFPVGTTIVTNVATSLAGQSNACYFRVTVTCDNRITVRTTRDGLELSWSGRGTLLRASTLGGTWVPVVSNVTSYLVVPTGRESYFRVRY